MPRDLRRYQHTGRAHFVTFSCYRREPNFTTSARYDLFVTSLEDMRRRFTMYVYGYVVMPEHVHLVKQPGEWKWSSFRHYALRESGVVEIESEWMERERETKNNGGPARIFLNPG